MGADLTPLYQIVQLATDLLPIAVTLGLIFVVVGLIFYMIGGGKLVNSLRIDKKLLYPMLALTIFGIFFIATPGNAAVGITLTASTVYGGTVVTFTCSGLTVASEYTLYFSGNSETIANVTFIANHATEYLPVGIPTDADNKMTANLHASVSGLTGTSIAGAGNQTGSAAATYFISLSDPAGILQTGFFFNVLVPMIIIFLVVGILVGIKTGVIGGKGMGKVR